MRIVHSFFFIIVVSSQVEVLSKVNHKNFVNIIGYCEEEEPFTRLMVFEYAPNGSLFEHLHSEYIIVYLFFIYKIMIHETRSSIREIKETLRLIFIFFCV